MRKTLRISKDKILVYSPQHHGYIDPEDIRGTTVYRPKKTRRTIKGRRTRRTTKHKRIG